MKKQAPPSRRITSKEDGKEIGRSWEKYHRKLARLFPKSALVPVGITEKVQISDGSGIMLETLPEPPVGLLSHYRQVETAIQQLVTEKWPTISYSNRRFLKGQQEPYHMGFYEQNLPSDPRRIWKLYKDTNKPLLLALKPILIHFDSIFQRTGLPDPCSREFGLFGTIFTTIVVNREECLWHIDPFDKFTILLYFGEFSDGELAVMHPQAQKLIAVTRYSTIILNSSQMFHKALPFKGTRFSISAWSKTATKFTAKGQLEPEEAGRFALQ